MTWMRCLISMRWGQWQKADLRRVQVPTQNTIIEGEKRTSKLKCCHYGNRSMGTVSAVG